MNSNTDKFALNYKLNDNSYHDLMPHKVHEILLVSTFYDAFIFEQDGILSEQFFGEYDQLSLGNIPRITNISNGDEALRMLEEKRYDVVITMMRIGDMTQYDFSRKIKDKHPNMPVILLLNVESDVELLNRNSDKMEAIDDVFLWHGDSKIFLAMIKHIEDKLNLENDTKNGLVNVILLVEDSVRYYSRFLPILYTEIMRQTQRLISAELSVMNKRRRMRIRPKVVMVHNYEDAVIFLRKYQKHLICVISDVKYPKDDVLDNTAGFQLMQKIKEEDLDIAMMMQSSNLDNAEKALELGSHFLHKNSDTLLLDLRKFILKHLGFGDLVFRNENNKEIARASNLLEFEALLSKVPAESIVYHAHKNHFSAWLIAHGEIQAARRIKPMKTESFPDPEDLRIFLFDTFQNIRLAKNKGKVIEFDKNTIDPEGQIIRLCDGSLGGKGRGLAFLNSLINSMNMDDWFENISIRTPKTFIIGTNEFDIFMENNEIKKAIIDLSSDEKMKQNELDEIDDAIFLLQKISVSDEDIQKVFLQGDLTDVLRTKLMYFLKTANYPIAVRSSGLLEDSQSQPFAGIYNTYMLPNNEKEIEMRLDKLMNAIKLVFASVFKKRARQYIKNINFKVEEEKMAVIIQNIVGTDFDGLYYPHISGVAQSFNYYPTSYLENDDGFASLAVGLGKTVVDGEKVYVFCPRYPKLEILSQEKMMQNSQKDLYAIDLKNEKDNIYGEEGTVKIRIRTLRENGSLEHVVSVWDHNNNRLKQGVQDKLPMIANFANVLKHDYFPLGQIISRILEISKRAVGVPVEIEFAVKLRTNSKKKHIFSLLQIRPLNVQLETSSIDIESMNKDELLLYSERSMGNGSIEDLKDVIVFNPDHFDATKTVEMQQEIEAYNEKLLKEDRKYLLIGPGRWGSRDRFLGIPVQWSQISNAKVIVEVGLKDFNVDASQGTHFFHNLMSMNVGYFNIPYNSDTDELDLDWLLSSKSVESKKYFRHIRFDDSLKVKIDGRKRLAVICKPE
jgi:CheY-like chemotaxis protein